MKALNLSETHMVAGGIGVCEGVNMAAGAVLAALFTDPVLLHLQRVAKQGNAQYYSLFSSAPEKWIVVLVESSAAVVGATAGSALSHLRDTFAYHADVVNPNKL